MLGVDHATDARGKFVQREGLGDHLHALSEKLGAGRGVLGIARHEQDGQERAVLARDLGVTPEALRRMEAGREHLSMLQVDAATRALHLPVWALVSDTRAY